MSSNQVSLIVGDHKSLEVVAEELRARGDEVSRISYDDPAAEVAAVDDLVATGARVAVLVIGHASCEGSARRSLEVIRSATSSSGASAGARVVLISARDYLGWPGRAESAIELAGLIGLGRSLALELGTDGVTVNVVCPPAELGPITVTEDPWAAPPPPLTGPVDSADIAYAVAFLSDPESGYITGQVIHVSGGLNVLSSLSA